MKHPKRITKRRSVPHEDVTVKSIFKSVFLALPIAAAIGLLLLLPVTALLLRSKDPEKTGWRLHKQQRKRRL